MRLLVIAAWMLWPPGASAGLRGLKMEEPRPFGYFTGDVVVLKAAIAVDGTTELVQASLPKPGPVTYWLDLTGVDVEETRSGGGRQYNVTLTYQTFYVPYDSRKLTIPSWTMRLFGSSGPDRAVIPAFTFTSSPLRELFPEKSGETVETFLRPDAKPYLLSSQPLFAALLGSTALALLSLTLLARHLAWWPFRRRPRRPFTRAARLIARPGPNGGGTIESRDALLVLHRAFDEALGRRMLAEDLERFLDEHPEHAGCRTGIAQFFECSRRAFFIGGVAKLSEGLQRSALLKLSRALAASERNRP